MPITLPPLTRRRFLHSALALGGLSLLGNTSLFADVSRSEDHLALLADIHIHQNKAHVVHDLNVFDRFMRAREQILAEPSRPSRIIVGGDCAYDAGLKEDYATMIEGFLPFREAGLPIHLALGNHDRRQPILDALAEYEGKPRTERLPGRVVDVLETKHADLILLDSLLVGKVAGTMEADQLRWLSEELDRRPEKPAILFAHHNPIPEGSKAAGLLDTSAFFEVIRPRKRVKAYVFGHTHRWSVREEDGIYRINVPTLVWRSDPQEPYGWVLAKFTDRGVELTLNCLEREHPKHGERHSLKWR